MHALVLTNGTWGALDDMARTVADVLGCRVIAFDRRPALELYGLVVLVTPLLGALDPRLVTFAALEVHDKAFALLTDAGPFGDPLFLGVMGAAQFGHARMQAPLHASMGWLADTRAESVRQAEMWGKHLADGFPAPEYPRGSAGKRVMR